MVREKLNDRNYIVATPDRRRNSRLCHVNMLKPYVQRQTTLSSQKVQAVMLTKTLPLALSGAEGGDIVEDQVGPHDDGIAP